MNLPTSDLVPNLPARQDSGEKTQLSMVQQQPTWRHLIYRRNIKDSKVQQKYFQTIKNYIFFQYCRNKSQPK